MCSMILSMLYIPLIFPLYNPWISIRWGGRRSAEGPYGYLCGGPGGGAPWREVRGAETPQESWGAGAAVKPRRGSKDPSYIE